MHEESTTHSPTRTRRSILILFCSATTTTCAGARQTTRRRMTTHDYYGELSMRARLHSEAVAAYERVGQLKPRDGRARYNYAAALEADMMRFSDTFNTDFVEALENVSAQYETACQLDPMLAEAQHKRHEIGSHLMNVRAMAQQYDIEGTRQMLRQEKARQSETGRWQKLKICCRIEAFARVFYEDEVIHNEWFRERIG